MSNAKNKRSNYEKPDATVEGKDTNKNGNRSGRNANHTERRNNRRDKGRPAETREGYNDVSWYAQNPQILADAASFAYANPLGSHLEYDYGTENPSIPGIFTFWVAPGPGKSENGTSAVNIAARNIYSFIRHANSGHANYNSPDLMLYLLAMDSIYQNIITATRSYGFKRLYATQNRYYGKALEKVMRIEIADMATYRAKLNELIVKASSLCVPADLTITKRHMWLFSNVYTDWPTPKGQLFVINPDGWWEYNPTKYTTGGCLEWKSMHHENGSDEPWDGMDFLAALETQIEKVIADEDMNIMSGDILKAFGPDKCVKLVFVPEDLVLAPVYQPEVLTQFNNATAVGNLWLTAKTNFDTEEEFYDKDVFQLGDALIYNPTINNWSGIREPFMFNMPMEFPTPADTMVASRLTCLLDDPFESGTTSSKQWYKSKIHSFGSDFCTYFEIYQFQAVTDPLTQETSWSVAPVEWQGGSSVTSRYLVTYMCCKNNTESNIDMYDMGLLSTFDNHPRIIWTTGVGENETTRTPIGDLQTYTYMTRLDLRKMHDCAILSEYSLPVMGVWNDVSYRK